MAAMTTVLNNFQNFGDKRTYFTTGHTAEKVKICVAARKVPTGNQTIVEASFAVQHATEDDAGLVLSSRPTLTCQFRAPINGQTADITAIKAIFRDFVAADEFSSLIDSLVFPAGTG